ncbi:MAG: hypothetical protein IJZ77_02775 [Bacilli bacterium]|nr:hypothetical protein [Bacilli bacterium]
MAKVAFSTLKLKQNKDVKTFKFADKEIEVLQYLPASDKYDLIMGTLQECYVDNVYNDFLKEVYFNLNIVFMYTNLTFTDKQKEDMTELYDLLDGNGFFNEVIENIPAEEYGFLVTTMDNIQSALEEYEQSIAGALAKGFNSLPQAIEAATTTIQNFDTSKYKEVVEFAQAVGMKTA